MIPEFVGVHRFLSNFYPSPIRVTRVDDPSGWRVYATVEHAYQALKAYRLDEHDRVWQAPTAALAKRLGQRVHRRGDWDTIRVEVMRTLVWAKFDQHPDLARRLCNTGDHLLQEGNWWGDRFWGVCRGEGENWLGKILMETRTRLLEESR